MLIFKEMLMEDLFRQTVEFKINVPRTADDTAFETWFRLHHWFWLGILALGFPWLPISGALAHGIRNGRSVMRWIPMPLLALSLFVFAVGGVMLAHGYKGAAQRQLVWTEGNLTTAIVTGHDTQWGRTPMRDGKRNAVVYVRAETSRGSEQHTLVFENHAVHQALPVGTEIQAIALDSSPVVLFPIEQGIRLIPR
ncbi:MAG: hypothetical protein ACI8RZ_004647 [Myxococcota bacterium]